MHRSKHDNRCQNCDLRIDVPGGSHSEGAHIRALGSPHNGPDTTGNVLCLCPNCHVMLDVGAIVIEDGLTVIRGDHSASVLRIDPRHAADVARPSRALQARRVERSETQSSGRGLVWLTTTYTQTSAVRPRCRNNPGPWIRGSSRMGVRYRCRRGCNHRRHGVARRSQGSGSAN
ncbi:HNH endonuclease [Streptomyces sp. NPDC050535]|uniref:HNH endonuclease n=1 Tax=Streptomyces sp. NPDC050535 TaxID=3365626 RepID=UPI00378CD6AB